MAVHEADQDYNYILCKYITLATLTLVPGDVSPNPGWTYPI